MTINLFDPLAVEGISLDFNPSGGNLWNFRVRTPNQRWVQPLHTASWAKHASSMDKNISLVERQLSGDFFCAPFGGGSKNPIHGWTANGLWLLQEAESASSSCLERRYQLEQTILGATVTKSLTLKAGHPFVYQTHRFSAGSGHLPVAHHAMIRAPGGAKLSFSRRAFGVTPDSPLETDPEQGRSLLLYPQTFDRLDQVLTRDNKPTDLTTYPVMHEHEDLLVLACSSSDKIAWSAALAQRDGFIFLSIKDATALPETVLWMSNGGRYYPPWNSQHNAVLGIEEASTSCHDNHRFDSYPKNSRHGIPAGLTLETQQDQTIRYCFGATDVPEGWSEIASVQIKTEALLISDVSGEEISLPFDSNFFSNQS